MVETDDFSRTRIVNASIRRAFELAAVILLAACGGEGDADPTGVVDPGSIRGTVTDNTSATVANATVTLTGSAQAARTTKR